MKIQGSSVGMSCSVESFQKSQRTEYLNMWTGNRRNSRNDGASATVEITGAAKLLAEKYAQDMAKSQSGISGQPLESEKTGDRIVVLGEPSEEDKGKIYLLEKMIEHLTGKKIKIVIPKAIKIKANGNDQVIRQNRAENGTTALGWGLEYEYHESYQEVQRLSFASAGVVKTADGRKISFSLEINAAREFYSGLDISLRAGDAVMKDPLVISLDNNIAGLAEQKIAFDIDCDGNAEQVSFVGPGSGFLCFDANGDGVINNGGELFGARTGNGFSELALYDTDGNNWIDENDDIYEKLRIWTVDAEGNRKLFALGQKGVGAIYLGNVNAGFELKDAENRTTGEIRKVGVYLREDGTAGAIQHVDIAI